MLLLLRPDGARLTTQLSCVFYLATVMELGLYNNLSVPKPFKIKWENLLFSENEIGGKSNALENLALKDNCKKLDLLFLSEALNYIYFTFTKKRQKDIIYRNPSTQPLVFNFLATDNTLC